MGKIKVLYTIPNFDTAGSGKALLNIAKGLDASKFEPHIMCLHSKGTFFQEVEASGIPVHIYPYIGRARPLWTLWKDCRRIASMFKKIAPDVIHSFNYSADYTEAIAARLAGIPWAFTKKNMSWKGPSGNAWLLRSYLAHTIAIQNTDMKKQFYPNTKKTQLIPRGVATSKFHDDEVPNHIYEQMQTDKETKIIICVANFVPVKGIEVLLEAFSKLKDEFTQWNLWLIGDKDNDYGMQLEQEVQSLSLENRVFFSGKQLDVRPYLRAAHLFVLPTKDEGRREGSPVALLEAMAIGLCVLGSRVPGIKDQLKEFEAHIFEPNNVDSLYHSLTTFMQLDIQDLTRKGKDFSTYVAKNYDIQFEIEKHQHMYQTILNR